MLRPSQTTNTLTAAHPTDSDYRSLWRYRSSPAIAIQRSIGWPVILVNGISIMRALLAVSFLAATGRSQVIGAAAILSVAIATDFIDGFLSRRMKSASRLGHVLDLIADKTLTAVTLLYAASRGMPLLPLALIIARDVMMLGMRAVVVDGTSMLSTNRLFGGTMAAVIWGNAVLLILSPAGTVALTAVDAVYWIASVVFVVNLALRMYEARHRLLVAVRSC